MRSSVGPTRPPLRLTVWHFEHRALPFFVEEQLFAELRIAGHIGLPVAVSGSTGQTANVGDDLVNLLVLQRFAELLHGRPRHAVLDHADNVFVLVAVQPAVVRQVRPFAAASHAAMTTAAQPTKQCAAFAQRSLFSAGVTSWRASVRSAVDR